MTALFAAPLVGLLLTAMPDAPWVNCLRITGKPTDIAGMRLAVARSTYVTAAPSKASAPVGTVVPVNGVQGADPVRVYFPACQNFRSAVSKAFYIRGV